MACSTTPRAITVKSRFLLERFLATPSSWHRAKRHARYLKLKLTHYRRDGWPGRKVRIRLWVPQHAGFGLAAAGRLEPCGFVRPGHLVGAVLVNGGPG